MNWFTKLLANENEAVIEFSGVTKKYPSGNNALDDINLRINKGEFVFVVGPSGAGKSSLIKLIMREEKATFGEVTVNGYKMSKIRDYQVPFLRRTMGIVFQDFRIIDSMTVYNNVAFALRVVGASNKEIKRRVIQALSIVGLSKKAGVYPHNLSGGERQRVAIARAIVNSPKIIIADEPTGNIDPKMSFELVKLFTEINKRGITVVMVTHAHDLVRHFNKRVIMLEKGKIVADNRASAVMN